MHSSSCSASDGFDAPSAAPALGRSFEPAVPCLLASVGPAGARAGIGIAIGATRSLRRPAYRFSCRFRSSIMDWSTLVTLDRCCCMPAATSSWARIGGAAWPDSADAAPSPAGTGASAALPAPDEGSDATLSSVLRVASATFPLSCRSAWMPSRNVAGAQQAATRASRLRRSASLMPSPAPTASAAGSSQMPPPAPAARATSPAKRRASASARQVRYLCARSSTNARREARTRCSVGVVGPKGDTRMLRSLHADSMALKRRLRYGFMSMARRRAAMLGTGAGFQCWMSAGVV